MPRKRTGTLRWHRGRWWAYITVETGKPRQWIDLQTTDEPDAERLMARHVDGINRGEFVPATKTARESLVTFDTFADNWLKERVAEGVVMAKDEKSTLKNHIRPILGTRPVNEIESHEIDAVLSTATKTVSHETVRHVRSLLSRMFKRAKALRLTRENPVADVGTPRQRGSAIVKERIILSDAEFTKLVECAAVPLWFRTAAVLSRFVGGMRLGDLNHLQWRSLDVDAFSSLLVPRRKTGKPQELRVPTEARTYLEAWYRECGNQSPEAFLFGLEGGKVQRADRSSWARLLRHSLHVAGVLRHDCKRGDKAAPRKDGTCCELMASDPLFTESETTLPVDFHSFRRGFATGLRRAGVDTLTALMVSAHGDTTTHKRYLAGEIAKLELPKEAFPVLSRANSAQLVLLPSTTKVRPVNAERLARSAEATSFRNSSGWQTSKPLVERSNRSGGAESFAGISEGGGVRKAPLAASRRPPSAGRHLPTLRLRLNAGKRASR